MSLLPIVDKNTRSLEQRIFSSYWFKDHTLENALHCGKAFGDHKQDEDNLLVFLR